MKKHLFILAAVIILFSAPAVAQSETGDDGGGLDFLVDFVNDWDGTLADVLIDVFFQPFLNLLKAIITELVGVLTHTPDVYPNPAVEEVHQQTLLVSYLLATLGFMTAGLLHMIGPVLGVSYREVRLVLPRMIAALVFGSVSLPLLQYMVDLTNALTTAFKPEAMGATFQEMAGISATVVIAYVINSWLFLLVLIVFLIRAAYIMFAASISPLLALGWSLPKIKRYADSFIAGWVTALLMAPLDMLVLRFMFEMLSGGGTTIGQSVSNWIFGMAAAVLLLLVPYQLYGASQAVVGQAYAVTGSVKTRLKKRKRVKRRQKRQRDWHRYRQERLKQLGNDPNYRNSVVGGDD
jgi:hypothetical protein